MIKKYQLFLEQIEVTKTLSYEDALKDFMNCLSDAQRDLELGDSYSRTAQFRSRAEDPKNDFEKIDEFMTKRGWSLNKIKDLSKMPNFYQEVYRQSTSMSAPSDYYLYKITNKEFPLQGFEWPYKDSNWSGQWNDSPGEPGQNELLIRFRYGWHKTKYGKLAIEQNMGSIDKFLKETILAFPSVIIESICENYDMPSTRYTQMINDKDILDCFIIESENYSIYIDSKELKNQINIEDKFLNQKQFDRFIFDKCESVGLNCRIIMEGDIRAKMDI